MPTPSSIPLTGSECTELLAIAHRAVEAGLRGDTMPVIENPSEGLRQRLGIFVTVKKQGELRGCMGYVRPVRPLFEAAAEMAEAAAFRDIRFLPVQEDEIDSLLLEISVLSPLERVSDISEIVIGESGLVIERGAYRGLLLPQVAVEQEWNTRTFLEHACVKAGLPRDSWEEPETEIYRFSAEVWEDNGHE